MIDVDRRVLMGHADENMTDRCSPAVQRWFRLANVRLGGDHSDLKLTQELTEVAENNH
jgi:hypothetical protein